MDKIWGLDYEFFIYFFILLENVLEKIRIYFYSIIIFILKFL